MRGRRGRTVVVLCAAIGTALLAASTVRGNGGGLFDHGAEAGAVPHRGGGFTPIPEYPTGICDAVTGGLELGRELWPNAVRAVGGSVEGRTIWAEHWGPGDAPQVIVVGQVHGNECSPLVFSRMVRAFDWRHVGVWLIPTLNPDGYASFSRVNAGGENLNADGYHVTQPETAALLEFTAGVGPVLSVHVHSPNSFIGWFGSPTAAHVATEISAASGLRYTVAGTRVGRNWFLWQGQQRVSPAGAVLIELNPIVRWEAITATLRGPVSSLPDIEALSTQAIAALDAAFAAS